ncbi:MAG: PQQ-binding-like beta-propeller repeat protein [Candidatus Acidiferrales bacterium]
MDRTKMPAARRGRKQPPARISKSAVVLIASIAFAAQLSWAQWSTVNGQDNQRYSPLTEINAQNIAQLGAAWIVKGVEPMPSSRATPIVDGDLMFVTAPPYVYAVDISAGKIAWRYDAHGPTAHGGVAVGDGLVFVGIWNPGKTAMIALRENTGELVWKTSLASPTGEATGGASGAPLFANGIVSIGTNADYGYRGQIIGLDAQTGKQVWRFYVVPSPGQPGSNTWPKNNDSWLHGGGAVWLDGVYDPELGLDFYVTGNAVPQYGGENRPGDNLFTDCLIALDNKTGTLRWYYQIVHHDIWEADIAEAPVLFEAQVKGKTIKAIGAIRTDGYLFMFDRTIGKPLGRIEERPVPQDAFQKTAKTQPYPVGAEPVLPDCSYWKTQPLPAGFRLGCFFTPASVETPNLLGPVYGMRSTPMAFDPQTHCFYATGNAGLQWFRRTQDPDFFSLGFSNRVPGLSKLGYGVLAAIDSRTDRIVWKKEFHGYRPSGALATAGGLVFQSAGNGELQAYDAETGSLAWKFQTGALIGGPPIAFENAGHEYIVTVAGGQIWAFDLRGTIPERPPLPMPPLTDFSGTVEKTASIQTASLVRDMGLSGQHYLVDEYAFEPYRAQVTAGTTVSWRNNGTLVHTIEAVDGSWSTKPLHPLDIGKVKFDNPGTYVYHCREYPWEYGEIIVVPAPKTNQPGH